MRKVWVTLLAVVSLFCLSADAFAQPGRTPPSNPYGGNPGYGNSGYPYQLTPHEQRLLARGEYTTGEIVAGGLVGTFFGFGTGHMVQGRWSDKGWIFTVGEAGGFGLMMYGLVNCVEDDYHDPYYDDGTDDCAVGSIVLGALAVGVFRIWELIDVWAGPAQHNNEVRALRWRLGLDRPQPRRWGVYAAPPKNGDGAVAGVTWRF